MNSQVLVSPNWQLWSTWCWLGCLWCCRTGRRLLGVKSQGIIINNIQGSTLRKNPWGQLAPKFEKGLKNLSVVPKLAETWPSVSNILLKIVANTNLKFIPVLVEGASFEVRPQSWTAWVLMACAETETSEHLAFLALDHGN